MSESPTSFVLYDETVFSLLNKRMFPFKTYSASLTPFEGLQHMDLIKALADRKYRSAKSLLKKLPAPLPPKDAAAAALFALAAEENMMQAILDHSPPVREFQYLGVGKVASLLSVACKFDKHKMLKLLLKHGADPNKNPGDPIALSPVEAAFCSDSYLCLELLLKQPGLKVGWTEPILSHWASLRANPNEAYYKKRWNCQLLMKHLTGIDPDQKELLPYPPQLQLGTALRHNNLPLATRICTDRPLSSEEIFDTKQYFQELFYPLLLTPHSKTYDVERQRGDARLLVAFLQACPHQLEDPVIRSVLAAAALAPVKPDEDLQHWATQLSDGRISFKRLPSACREDSSDVDFMDETLFPRWDQRLGRRLIPTLDINSSLSLQYLTDDEIRMLLERVTFTGQRQLSRVCHLSMQLMEYAPPDMLPGLMQSGNLLALEHPQALLEACQQLPPDRRNLLLPYIRKEVHYDL